MSQVVPEAMSQPYDLLLGRTTYDLFASTFPHAGADNPVAAQLNEATKHVVTSRPEELPWRNSSPITADVVTEVSILKSQPGLLIQVHGSWQLVQTLLENDLVDEIRLWIFPVVVGSGKRLFESGTLPSAWVLSKCEPCEGGAVMAIYRKP